MPANITTSVICTQPPVLEITGTIDAVLTGSSSKGGPVSMTINFDQVLPVNIAFDWGFDYTSTNSKYTSSSNQYPLPNTYKSNAWCGGGRTGTSLGVSSMQDNSTCAEPGAPYGYISKVVFYNTIFNGYTLKLRPVRSNMSFEVR